MIVLYMYMSNIYIHFSIHICCSFYLELKHRYAANNCALAAGYISNRLEILFRSLRIWTLGLSQVGNKRLAHKLACHRSHQTWTHGPISLPCIELILDMYMRYVFIFQYKNWYRLLPLKCIWIMRNAIAKIATINCNLDVGYIFG